MEPVVSSAPFMPPIEETKHANVFLFGDLTTPFESDLRQLLHCKNNALLQSFFERVNLAYRREFAQLSVEQQEWLPRFTDLVDLMSNFEGLVGASALRCSLLCVYQIGRFIRSDASLSATTCYLIGVCTGTFATAAVSASRTLAELVSAGVEAALAAFRTGLYALKVQRDLEPVSVEGVQPWSFLVNLTESQAEECVASFSANARLPSHLQPYVSAVSPSAVTLSGPPRSTKRLFDSGEIKAHPISIHAPYHASHLYDAEDVDEICGQLRNGELKDRQQHVPMLSIATGARIDGEDLHSLLRRAIQEALCEQVRWDKLCPSVRACLAKRPTFTSCVVHPVASNAGNLLCGALQRDSRLQVTMSSALNCKVERTHTEPAPGKFQDAKIAIIGFSGRFPEAASNEELWELLQAARDCHREIPKDRFDWEAHYDAQGKQKNRSRVKFGCFINDPGVFDTRFFNLSPREAENTDPAQRLALMCTYEAIEMAGLVPDTTPSTQRDRIGVFFGVTSDDWREVNSGQDIDTYFIPGGNRAFVPGRISYFFRFSGPSVSVDTACSSSFAAISTACNALWQGDCDSAVAGGTNVLTNPDNFTGLDRGHFLSATGNCNPFDDSANGYCRADAVGAVILKRLDDALSDGDPIFGVIAGCNTNHCGQTVSITRPHEGDQLSLFKRMLRQSNTDPADVSYVEMHGTGTQAGDAAEMRSVLAAFAPDHRRSAETSRPLHLGAIKANVGHAESASGVTALIKVLMMMQHSKIPPQRINGVRNHGYPDDLTARNVHIAMKTTPWRREDCPSGSRRAFLNNFSAAGGNTAVLLEDAPLIKSVGDVKGGKKKDARDVWVVAVTAKTLKALGANMSAFVAHLSGLPDTHLPALSYTTTARRSHHKFRVLVSGSSIAAIQSALRRRTEAAITPIKGVPPKVAFVFTGQGTLYAKIATQFFHHVPSFRSDLIRFGRIARRHGFPTFLPLVSGEVEQVDAQDLDPVLAHLVVTCVQMALAHLFTLWVGVPSCVTGHSLGEYAALYTANVISASDTIYLVGSRARLLTKYCSKGTHSMLAVKAPCSVVSPELEGTSCAIACANSPVSTTISGPKQQLESLATLLKYKNLDVVHLDVPYAFHSTQVDPILAEFNTLASVVHYDKPTIPYLSPRLAVAVTGAGVLDANYLTRAARECVNFQGAIENARDSGLASDSTIWLEMGIHPACSGMIKQTIGSHATTAPTLRKDGHTWKVLASSLETLYLAGVNIDWSEFHRGFEAAQCVLPLPSYKWDLSNYWIQYRHNFCLTKGDDPASFAPQTPAVSAASLVTPSLSSSVHRILEESVTSNTSTLVVESDLHDPRLAPIIKGHQVNTAMLCPSSLYADMALTVAKRMLESSEVDHENAGLDCGTMNVQRPLILQPTVTTQLLRVSAKAEWSDEQILLEFFSVNAQGRKISDHASCKIKITKKQDWLNVWKRNAYLITSRITSLHDAVDQGEAHKLKRGLAYKLFASLVDYADDYQGMQQVVLDSESLEATAEVKFQVGDQGFNWNPCWIDSLGHIAGFIMNGNDNTYSKDQVFINHGWDAMRCGKPVKSDRLYTTYCRMQLESGTMYVGNTYIFDDLELIAIFEGVRFQGVNRSVLDHLLPGNARPAQVKRPSTTSQVTAPKSVAVDSAPKQTPIASRAEAPMTPPDTPPDNTSQIMKIILEEAQISENELDLEAEFADLGVDSLLSLTIVSRLQDELGIEVPTSAFMTHTTIKAFVCHIGGEPSLDSALGPSTASTPSSAGEQDGDYLTDATSSDDEISKLGNIPKVEDDGSCFNANELPHASSVLLQGSSKSAKHTLFLFPDGAGSATSYHALGNISPDVVVYGLNCPWLKTPQDLKCSLEQYVTKFLVEVRRRQPSGPYNFGGMSAGGILAYEAVQQLHQMGDKVDKLILLDTPDPVGLENPNQRLYDFLDSMGMFGLAGKTAPTWLRPHFDAFLKLLDAYSVKCFAGSDVPMTHIVYARDGMCKHESDPRPEIRPDDPREMLWLLNNRTDFSGAGWRSLLGKENLRISVLDDVNHYTILQAGPKMQELSARIARAFGA